MSSQQIQYHHHHNPGTQYIHYNPSHLQQQQNIPLTPHDTQHLLHQSQHNAAHYTHHYQQQMPHQQQQAVAVAPTPQPRSTPQPQASTSSTSTPLVATGDWTKDLVHLAKTAELKKHALTLQLHTAHILSAHASLQEKSRAIQDIKEQKNKLESERKRLLNALREINEDKDKADMLETKMENECQELRTKITQLTEAEYASAKSEVDRLRQELGQPPLPSLQSTLDEKAAQYLNERRLTGPGPSPSPGLTIINGITSATAPASASASGSASASAGVPVTAVAGMKRGNAELSSGGGRSGAAPGGGSGNGKGADGSTGGPVAKRPRGRPKGSKNKAKDGSF